MPDGLDPYAVLEVCPSATQAELKAAYRRLVKQHHPDAGGTEERILALNAAWEQLGDPESRRDFDRSNGSAVAARDEARARGARNARASQAAQRASGRSSHADQDLANWLTKVYAPIDRLLGQVINPFAAELRALSADPYDDALMEAFCAYLDQSRSRLDKVKTLFQDTTDGIAVKLLAYVESQVDDEGAIADRMTNLTNQSTDIDDQVERLESFVQMRRQAMIDSFVAMESAQQKINQQMQFIQSRFG